MALDSSVTVIDYFWEYAGDESEDSLPKRVRVRSIASVCGDFVQPIKGAYLTSNTSLVFLPLAMLRFVCSFLQGGVGLAVVGLLFNPLMYS